MSAAPDLTQNRGGTNVTYGPMAKWTGTGAMAEFYQWSQGLDRVKGRITDVKVLSTH